MKVAVQIAGLPRFSKEFDEFINSMQGYDQIDWFFYLWNDGKDQFVAPFWKSSTVDQMREKIANHLPANHNIAYLELHDCPEYTVTRPLNTTQWTNPPNVWYMHLGLKLVTEIREQYEAEHGKYDIVVKARCDSTITPGIDLKAAKLFFDQHPRSILTSANHRLGLMGRVVSEPIAFGTSETISTVCKMFDHLFEYNDQGVLYHPETLTAHHLYVNNIDTPMTDFSFEFRKYKLPDGTPDWGHWN